MGEQLRDTRFDRRWPQVILNQHVGDPRLPTLQLLVSDAGQQRVIDNG